MILTKTIRSGETQELSTNDNYNEIVNLMDAITEELELKGVMLIKTEVNRSLSRTYQFSSIKNGWECVLILFHGYVTDLN